MGAGLLAVGVAGWKPRWTGPIAFAVTMGLVGYGLRFGVLVPADILVLPSGVGLADQTVSWASWALFAGAVTRAPWPSWRGGRFAPVLAGALCGEFGGAVLAASGVTDPSVRARRVLAASAGALFVRVSDPALWLMGTSAWAWGLALLGVWIAQPPAVTVSPPAESEGDGETRARAFWGVAGAVGLAAMWPAGAPVVLGAAALGLSLTHRRWPDFRPLVAVLGFAVVLHLAVAGGAAEAVASALESRTVVDERWMSLWVLASGAVAGTVFGSGGGALVGTAVLDRALGLRVADAHHWFGLMAAVAGAGPLVVTGTLAAGAGRHIVWVLASFLVLGLLHGVWELG